MEIKDIKKDLLLSALWDIVKLILGFALVTSSTLFTSELITNTFVVLKEYKIHISVIMTSGGILLLMYLYQVFRKDKPRYPNLEFDFSVLEKEISIDFLDDGQIFYKKRNFLKALNKNLNAYHDKYHWTGSKEVNIDSNIKGQKFQKTIKKNIFQLYQILFNQSLKKGETIETELIWSLKDASSKMVPFVSATIHEPTSLLILNISFSKEQNINEVICEVTSSIGANKMFETNKVVVDRNGQVVWRIRNPKLLFHYEMNWFK